MSDSISSLTNSALIVSNANSAQNASDSPEELTDEQKKKIAKIEADLAAKLITKAEADQKIADVKASGIKRKKKPQKSFVKKSQNQNDLAATAEAEKAKAELVKSLKEILKSKEKGLLTETDVNNFIDKLKSSLVNGEPALIDKTA
jgi:hypothetical protein